MTPLHSLVVLPLAMLSACGGLQTKGISVWDCKLSLVSPDDARLRRKLSFGRGISIDADRTGRSGAVWTAWGHLDGGVHVVADPPFPVINLGDDEHPVLEWEIHGLRVRAKLMWGPTVQKEGEIQLEAFVPVDQRRELMWGDVSSFRMKGNCERDRQSEANLNTGKRS